MFLKVKYHAEVHFLKIINLESEEFSVDKTIASIVQQLNIDTEYALAFRDRDGAEFFFDDFQDIIRQYKGCSCFLLEIYENSPRKEASAVSSLNHKDLENYIRSGDFSSIFEEYKNTNTLSDSSRRTLVRESTNFLRQRCGNHPKREEKIALAESIIRHFPAYKITNSKFGGIDLFFNPENNSGYLVAKLKNINTKLTKLGGCSSKKRKLSEVNKESDDSEVISEEDLRFFQNCIVKDELNLVQQKLRETLKSRQKFIATACNVLENFPIFVKGFSIRAGIC